MSLAVSFRSSWYFAICVQVSVGNAGVISSSGSGQAGFPTQEETIGRLASSLKQLYTVCMPPNAEDLGVCDYLSSSRKTPGNVQVLSGQHAAELNEGE